MERFLFSEGGLALGIAAAAGYAFLALGLLTLDRFRAGSTSKDDGQLELKVLIFALALIGLTLVADGAAGLLGMVLGGFKGAGDAIKQALAPILVGAGTLAALALGVLPRTNSATARGPELLALLVVGLYFGIGAISGAYVFIASIAMSSAWSTSASAAGRLVVDGAVAFVALVRLGTVAGWTVPVRPPPPPYPPPSGYPPPGGGYPPQGGGYPPQGGGYPPQGGGYPPQGGGYPPPGGGYPPPGGGYPPR